MSPAALIDSIRSHGGTLEVDGDSLTVKAPKGVLTPELLAQLRRYKPALLAYLLGERPTLAEYREFISGDDVLRSPDLPPDPPYRLGDPEHKEAWSAWWDAVERQRRQKRG